MQTHQRHDISDRAWENIKDFLPGAKGSVGRPPVDNRLFINAVFWVLRTGIPWRDLPPDLGDWPIVAMTVTSFSKKLPIAVCRLLFPPRGIAGRNVTMIPSCTESAILLRMPSCI